MTLAAALDARLLDVLRRAIPRLPARMQAVVADLISPANAAITAGVLGGWAASHAVGIGALADLGLAAFGLITLGDMAYDVARQVGRAIEKTATAEREADLDAAAVELAGAIAMIGATMFAALVMKRAGRLVPAHLPRLFAMTAEEWLYRIGVRRIAPRQVEGVRTVLAFLEPRRQFLRNGSVEQAGPLVEGWLKAMDLSRPVWKVTLRAGTEIVGYMQVRPQMVARIKANPLRAKELLGALQPHDLEFGSFFTTRGTPMSRLGIGRENRILCRFRVTRDIEVLQSTTSPAFDTWTVKKGFIETAKHDVMEDGVLAHKGGNRRYKGQLVDGGALQYVIPEASHYLRFTGDLVVQQIGTGTPLKRGTVEIPKVTLY